MKQTPDQITEDPNEFSNIPQKTLKVLTKVLDFLDPNNPDMSQIFCGHSGVDPETIIAKRKKYIEDGTYSIRIRGNGSRLVSDNESTIEAQDGKMAGKSPYDGPITRMDSLIRKIAPFITSIVPQDIIDQVGEDQRRNVNTYSRVGHELNLSIEIDNNTLRLTEVLKEEELYEDLDPRSTKDRLKGGYLDTMPILKFNCMKIFGWLLENEDMIREAYKKNKPLSKLINKLRIDLQGIVSLPAHQKK